MSFFKKNIVAGLVLLVLGVKEVPAQTIISGGPLTGTLTLAASPYKITGDVNVPFGGILTIQAGVRMYFDQHFGMSVSGQLLVNGTQAQPVLFTEYDTTGFSNYADTIGGWHGVAFAQSATTDTSVVHHAIFEYTKSIEYDWTGSGIVFVSRSNVIVDSSEFRNCVNHLYGSALLINNSSPWISGCYLHDNFCLANSSTVAGGTIGIYNGASPHIEHCRIQNNVSHWEGGAINVTFASGFIGWCDISNNFTEFGQGGGICLNQASPTIYHNTIHHNQAYNGGGGIAVRSNSDPDIDGNLICNNFAETCGCGATDGGGAIRVDGGSTGSGTCDPLIRNNVMSNNHTLDNGGGIYLYFTSARIFNNDIAYNFANGMGGGIYTWGSGSTTFSAAIKNNIVSGNYATTMLAGEQIFVGNYYYPRLSYNIIDNGQSGVHASPNYIVDCDSTNFAANPLWLSPPAAYGPAYDGTLACWLIPLSSPAHNAGDPDSSNCYISANDYANDVRFMENRLDIGAVEIYAAVAGVQTISANENSFAIFPNPANSSAHLYSENGFENNSNVFLTSIDGKIIQADYTTTKKEIEINLSGIAGGVYTVTVESVKKKQTALLVVRGE